MTSPTSLLDPEAVAVFSEEARRAIYECIELRRDIRHFQHGKPIDGEVLFRILSAAHQAPSVGLSQPWGFVIVRDEASRERIRESFLACREAEASRFPPARRSAYLTQKLEGIQESALNVCVVADLRDQGETILGTTAQPEAVRASACCAVQNLWLAARAEGIGVGWVSIVEPALLRHELDLPPGVEPIAYLCLGHPIAFRRRPMLEETGWRRATTLSQVVHWDGKWRLETKPLPAAAAAPSRGAPLVEASAEASAAAIAHSATLTKPIGSLGRLETISAFYAGARGVFPAPKLERATLLLFAADHGIAAEGVSAFSSTLTAAMVCNVMAGGAAVNALADQCDVGISLTDVGITGDLSAAPRAPVIALQRHAVGAGARNFAREPALTPSEVEAAFDVGVAAARAAARAGSDAIALGEIGIANTTSAATLTCVFTKSCPAQIVGRGTGINDAAFARKIAVVEQALALHRPDPSDPRSVLAAIGGLEIAALVGAMHEAARQRRPIVLDGFVTNAAALVAVAMEPKLRGYLLASHASTEPGARVALAHLGLEPLLELELRLGEGTGACLGVALLRSAVHVAHTMATFATAGIVGRSGLAGAAR